MNLILLFLLLFLLFSLHKYKNAFLYTPLGIRTNRKKEVKVENADLGVLHLENQLKRLLVSSNKPRKPIRDLGRGNHSQ